MQTHLALRTLKGLEKPDKDVQVLFATQPDRKALLFIHGFSGNAIETWADFHELLPLCHKCCHRDLFFYGYDGLRADMNASAAIFCDFLDRFFSNTRQLLSDNLPTSGQRPSDFQYDELVIVGHSLGAVILRRGLLNATKANLQWVAKTKMVLYAPAHMGAKVADLALEAASSFPFIRLFGIGARFESPLIDQLKPNSVQLTALLKDTNEATKDGKNPHLLAKKVIIAEYEKIVENEIFGLDPPPKAIYNTNHKSVCKPRSDFLEPLKLLEICL